MVTESTLKTLRRKELKEEFQYPVGRSKARPEEARR